MILVSNSVIPYGGMKDLGEEGYKYPAMSSKTIRVMPNILLMKIYNSGNKSP